MPPSPRTTNLRAAQPHAVNQTFHQPPAHTPRQPAEHGNDTVGQIDVTDPGHRPVLRQHGLSVVTGAGAAEEPFAPVMVTEDAAQLEVITPHLKLPDGPVTSSGQTSFFCAAVGGFGVECPASEPLIDQGGHVLIEKLSADRSAVMAVAGGASVSDVAVRVDDADEHHPAPGAPGHTGEQPVLVAAGVVADPSHTVRSSPQVPVDDRRPRILDSEAARSDEHAERSLGANDPHNRGGRPPSAPVVRRQNPVGGQPVRYAPPTRSCGPFLEDPGDHTRSGLIDLCEAQIVADVSVGGAPGEPAGGRSARLSGRQCFVGLVSLPLTHDEQQPQHRPSHRGGGVDALRDTDDAGASLGEFLDDSQSAEDGSREPVQAGDDDAAALTVADALESGVHAGPVHGAAGPVEIFVPRPYPDPVRRGPSLDCFALGVWGLEAVAGASCDLGDTYVAVHRQHPRIVLSAVKSARSVSAVDKKSAGHAGCSRGRRSGDPTTTVRGLPFE